MTGPTWAAQALPGLHEHGTRRPQPGDPCGFRIVWPIVDDTITPADLLREAAGQIDDIAARTGAAVTGQGRFAIRPSATVPGSGNITERCVVFEAAAHAVAVRGYRNPATTTAEATPPATGGPLAREAAL